MLADQLCFGFKKYFSFYFSSFFAAALLSKTFHGKEKKSLAGENNASEKSFCCCCKNQPGLQFFLLLLQLERGNVLNIVIRGKKRKAITYKWESSIHCDDEILTLAACFSFPGGGGGCFICTSDCACYCDCGNYSARLVNYWNLKGIVDQMCWVVFPWHSFFAVQGERNLCVFC